MHRPSHLVLLDGSLAADARERRAEIVAAMARLLIEMEAWTSAADAILVLRVAGYSRFDIDALIDDARQVAVQHLVAREIAAS